MAYAGTSETYNYDDPCEGLIIEMCRSFVVDYCKAIKKNDRDKADRIEYEFRHCHWLPYITERPDELVTMMLEEGDRIYGR